MDQRKTYDIPELKKIGNVNELTQGLADPTSGEPVGAVR